MKELNRYGGAAYDFSLCLRIAIEEIDVLHQNQLKAESKNS